MARVTKAPLVRKPHRDFPLTPHASGRWCKKVKGHFYYFGRTDRDPDGADALQNWRDRKEAILAGDELEELRESRLHGKRRRQPTNDALTVEESRNAFLEAKESLVASGEITKRHFHDLQATTRIMRDTLGGHRSVEDLTPEHFRRLRDTRWPSVTGHGHCRMPFNESAACSSSHSTTS
ncbi:MAG TPA: hypothetical protein VHX65_19890 [Pirellulales bacterium]|jgi:hypothetical protein|nr:hypothetical protein [Pirellulales bacterium]